MKRKKKAWKSILLLIFIVCIIEIAMVALVIEIPDFGALFAAVMVITYIVAILRMRRIIINAKIAKKAAILRQQSAKNGGSTSSYFYNRNATQSNMPTGMPSMAFVNGLRKIARDYANKAQRQKYAFYERIQDVCDKLNAYALSRGVKLGEKEAETLLIAMASSKCIFVKKTGENTEDILSIIGEFFSQENSECIQLEPVPTRVPDLFNYYNDKVLTSTEFFNRVYTTAFLNNTVCTCAVKDISQVPFARIFVDFISLFKNPYGDTVCYMSQIPVTDIPKIEDRKFILPKNTWFFFLLNGDEQLPKDASLWSETIEIKGVGSKNNERVMGLPMSYSQFNELVEGAFDENFLPLDTWKKLDKVEDYLSGAIGFKIDNVLARQIECLTTMHVACGSTQAQAMDMAIAHKVLPFLVDYKKEQIDQEGTSLKELLDALFGAENLPECHKMLSILQLD